MAIPYSCKRRLHARLVLGQDAARIIGLARGVFILHILDSSHLLHNHGTKQVTRNVEGGTEAVEEPINGVDNAHHASDGDTNKTSNHDGQGQGRRGNRRRSNRRQSGSRSDDDIVDSGEVNALGTCKEDNDNREVNGSSAES